MNLSPSLFSFLSLGTRPGNLGAVPHSLNWKDFCHECGKVVITPKGLFCANYGAQRANLIVCKKAWCGKCYKAYPHLEFHVNEATNEVGAVWRRKGKEGRFLTARNGDIWLAPFQRDFCWFFNLQGRILLTNSPSDLQLMGYI